MGHELNREADALVKEGAGMEVVESPSHPHCEESTGELIP